VGVIGRIHQDAVAEEVGDHSGHLLAFVDHDAGEEAPTGHVFAGLTFKNSRNVLNGAKRLTTGTFGTGRGMR
jgi:hypothetical protein